MTMANFALFLPDWNSLDSVRRAHSDLEFAAIVFFALLVVFDVLAHFAEENKKRETLLERIGLCFFAVAVLSEMAAYRYGQRNDALSAQVIVSLDAKAQDASDKADHAKTTADGAKIKADAAGVDADQAQTKAEVAGKEAAQVGASAANALSTAHDADEVATAVMGRVGELESARFLDWPTQINGITLTPKELAFEEVKRYAGTRVLIQPVLGREPSEFAATLYTHLSNIGWNPQIMLPPPSNRPIPPGVWIDTPILPYREPGAPQANRASALLPELRKSTQAAVALKKLLEFNLSGQVFQTEKFEAGTMHPINLYGFDVPMGALVIEVGPNPSAPHPDAQQSSKPSARPYTKP